jgi:pimeloyl-ACP methyl ester carboxylesterase
MFQVKNIIMDIRQESIFIDPPSGNYRLHVRRICPDSAGGADAPPLGPPVLMLHGAIENGRIFFTESGKGFAPFLARQGFDVYVADLRGRGLSVPPISRASRFGQFEAITEDLPAFIDLIRARRGEEPQFWVAHSWGGVLFLSFFARFRAKRRDPVKGMVFFGTKRSIRVRGFRKFLMIDLFWNLVARAAVRLYGYLPAREWGAGSDNESDLSHLESKVWVKPGPWIDPRDAYDYGQQLRRVDLPPTLYLAGSEDYFLGNPRDVQDLIREAGSKEFEFWLLNGYGHIDMLTRPEATLGHFRRVLDWMRNPG